MKVTRLIIKGFLGIGNADVSFAGKGLVLLQGINKDDPSANSNGSGKSSLVDALLWCLFGETSRGLTADDVVNRFIKGGCSVTAEIEDEGRRYTIERWRKIKRNGKMAGVHAVEHLSPAHVAILTKGTDKLTQLEIDRVVGCTKDVFSAAIYSAQEAMPDLPAMSDKPLKVLIEEAAGITVLERAHEIARKKLLERERDLAACEEKTSAAKRAWDSQAHHVDDLDQEEVAWGGSQAEAIKEADAKTQAVLEEARKLSAEIKALPSDEDYQAQIDALTGPIKECGARILAIKGEQAKLAELTTAVSAAQRKLTVASMEAKNLAQRYKDAVAHRNHLNTAGPQNCGECGREIEGVDKTAAIALADTKVEAARLPAANALSAVKVAEIDVKNAEQAVADYRATMTDVSAILNEQDTHLKASRKLKDAQHARALKVTALDERKRQVVALNARKKELEAETNPFTALVAEARRKLEERKEAAQKCDMEQMEASEKVSVAQAVVSVYGPKGVRAHIIDTVTPFLNDRTAQYLGALSDGKIEAVWNTISFNKSGEMAEKFSITVEKDGGGSFKALSGGEKRKVRLACALALQDLVASRASKPIDLFIGDEIDEALDAAGLERLMNLLENKARERGTVIVISHNDLKDWVRQVSTVTMKGGQATIDGDLCR